MSSAHHQEAGPLSPVMHELSRITGAVESERAERDRATIEALRKEVTELRATVAQLRASRPPAARPPRPVPSGTFIPEGFSEELPQARSHADA